MEHTDQSDEDLVQTTLLERRSLLLATQHGGAAVTRAHAAHLALEHVWQGNAGKPTVDAIDFPPPSLPPQQERMRRRDVVPKHITTVVDGNDVAARVGTHANPAKH